MNWIIHRKYKCYQLIWSENTVKQVKTITPCQERQQRWCGNQGHCVIAHEQVTASLRGHKIGIHQPQSSIKFYQFYCFCLAVSEPVTQNYQLKTELLLAGSSVPMHFQANISLLFSSLAINFISKHGIELAIVYF